MIGKGEFGQVFRASLYRRIDVVVKSTASSIMDAMRQKAFAREAHISAKASESNHANVLKFWGVCISHSSPEYWYLVYQYLPGGSLESVLLTQKRYFTESLDDIAKVVQMAVDAASGLAHLHAAKIIHRDVACRNLLMDSVGNVWYVMLCCVVLCCVVLCCVVLCCVVLCCVVCLFVCCSFTLELVWFAVYATLASVGKSPSTSTNSLPPPKTKRCHSTMPLKRFLRSDISPPRVMSSCLGGLCGRCLLEGHRW